jgi:hypothetical protein
VIYATYEFICTLFKIYENTPLKMFKKCGNTDIHMPSLWPLLPVNEPRLFPCPWDAAFGPKQTEMRYICYAGGGLSSNRIS